MKISPMMRTLLRSPGFSFTQYLTPLDQPVNLKALSHTVTREGDILVVDGQRYRAPANLAAGFAHVLQAQGKTVTNHVVPDTGMYPSELGYGDQGPWDTTNMAPAEVLPQGTYPAFKVSKPPARFQGGKTAAKPVMCWTFDQVGGKGSHVRMYDLFGGSGLLSRWFLDASIVQTSHYSDFDGYHDRVAYMNSADFVTDYVAVKDILTRFDVAYNKRIPAEAVAQIEEHFQGTWDGAVRDTWLLYLSFAGRAGDTPVLSATSRYNRVPKTAPKVTLSWFDGMIVVRDQDARQQVKDIGTFPAGSLVVLDPPYPSKDGASPLYELDWTLSDYKALVEECLARGADTVVCYGNERSGIAGMFAPLVQQGLAQRLYFTYSVSFSDGKVEKHRAGVVGLNGTNHDGVYIIKRKKEAGE